jgi:predicted house-cleaning noncanonical NTP pyrophosphatase (MazG superfamily)
MKTYRVMQKLGRDNIPKILDEKNIQYDSRVLENNLEYEEALYSKLIEEVYEFLEAKTLENFLEELADIQEVIRAFLALKNITWEDLEQVREEKLAAKGGFTKRIFFEKISEE